MPDTPNPRAEAKDKLVTSKETETSVLFRFMNVTDPETTVPNASIDQGFLENAHLGDSAFSEAFEAATTYEVNDAIKAALDDFKPIKTYADVRNMNRELFDFSEFVVSFSLKTPKDSLLSKTVNVPPLNKNQEVTLWDNLYFHAIRASSAMVANTIVHMLRANAFLKEYRRQEGASVKPSEEETAENRKKLLRLAIANLVIPETLITRQAHPVTFVEMIDPDTKNSLLQANNADKARFQIGEIDDAIAEISDASSQFTLQNTSGQAFTGNESINLGNSGGYNG